MQSHAKAFESLLALTPAQDYYGSQIVDGKDPSEQWNRKKQTKEQKRAAKKAKLDPANQKSALDVLKEREAEAMRRKRKREEDEGEDGENVAAEPVEAPKRKKGEEDADAAEAKRRAKAEKRKEKRQQKKEKVVHRKEKAEAKKAAKQDRDLADAQVEKQRAATEPIDEDDKIDEDEPDDTERDADLEDVDFSGLADQKQDEMEEMEELEDAASEGSSAPSTPAVDSPAFDVSANHSAASSSSSIIPPEEEDESSKAPPRAKQAPQRPRVDTKAISTPEVQQPSSKSVDPPSGVSSPKIQLPDIDHEELQARVRKRIEELRAARKADGPDGKPAKSRQELLEQRRQKGEQRKAAKKAQRQKQKEDEAQRREEQLRGSGSPLSADIFSPRSPRPQENNYSFSRLAFEDGTSADPSMTSLRDPKKTKGPSDPRTALQAAQKKQSRLAGYDSAKRAEIGEKDMWLHARQRAQGERVRDDTSLLKKALKRKEKQKNKSEKQWQEREQAVVKGKEAKQKKREANLQKRKEEKGGKGKKGKGGKSPGGGGKKKGRPGFEGRFKA